jgi:flagellar motor switch protein FliG
MELIMEEFTLEELELSITNAERKYQKALLTNTSKKLLSMLRKDVLYLYELKEEMVKKDVLV